jgi:Domain of unknown function (DUF397)
MKELARERWTRSTRCESGACVEVTRLDDDAIAMRDSKIEGGSVLLFTATTWRNFLEGLRAGEFDQG